MGLSIGINCWIKEDLAEEKLFCLSGFLNDEFHVFSIIWDAQ